MIKSVASLTGLIPGALYEVVMVFGKLVLIDWLEEYQCRVGVIYYRGCDVDSDNICTTLRPLISKILCLFDLFCLGKK